MFKAIHVNALDSGPNRLDASHLKKEKEMKSTYVTRRARVSGLLLFAVVVSALTSFALPTQAATDTASVVKYGPNDIVTVKAKLRFSTLIILPAKEEILDFTTGDKRFLDHQLRIGFLHLVDTADVSQTR